MESSNWIKETLFDDYQVNYKIDNSLHDEETPFQSMEIVDSLRFGKMLLLDGVVQTTEKDEFVYHEMMTHVALFSHPDPKKVLIIGGGDGGILREVLKHKNIEKATMVEIDGRVVEFCKKHLPTLSAGAFDEPRTDLVIDDGAKFVKNTNEKYDVVIVDSCDPIGPATVLFTQEFYGDIKNCMNPDGILIRQSGSSVMQPDELRDAIKFLNSVYKHNAVATMNVPTYAGGLFCMTFSSDSIDPLAVKEASVEEKFNAANFNTDYYNSGVHYGSLRVPQYIKKIISS